MAKNAFRRVLRFGASSYSTARGECDLASTSHNPATASEETADLHARDRLLFAALYRLFPTLLPAVHIVRPETIIRWHRMGFRTLWRWKSRPRGGRPKVSKELRALIREMSRTNPLWGAPRIHGELKMLGIDVSQSTVAKYMVNRHGPPSQSWKTFLDNHANEIAACDFLVVPTLGFKMLYAFIVLSHDRRKLLHVAVTDHPTAAWTAQQLIEAFAWDDAPKHLIRDSEAVQLFGMGPKQPAERYLWRGFQGQASCIGHT